MSVQLIRSIDDDLLAEVSEALRKKEISHYVTPKTPKTQGAVWLREEGDLSLATHIAEDIVVERDRFIRSLYSKKKRKKPLTVALRKNQPMVVFAILMAIVLALWYFYFLVAYAT